MTDEKNKEKKGKNGKNCRCTTAFHLLLRVPLIDAQFPPASYLFQQTRAGGE